MTSHDRDVTALKDERDPPVRTLWRCWRGHEWSARGERRPAKCPDCGTKDIGRQGRMV